MLTIRLFRVGKKRQPVYKIVVTDKKNPPSAGRFIDDVGFYNPITKEKKINKERVCYWISKGAQKSETVHNLLIKEKIIEGQKKRKHKTSKKKIEVQGSEEKPKEENKTKEFSKETISEKPVEEIVQQETPKESVEETSEGDIIKKEAEEAEEAENEISEEKEVKEEIKKEDIDK